MALIGDVKLTVTNLTGASITFWDIYDTVTDPVTSGHPTVGAGGTLDLTITPSALISWEKGLLNAGIVAGDITVTSSTGGGSTSAPEQYWFVGKQATVDATEGTVVLGQFAFPYSVFSPEFDGVELIVVASTSGGETGTIELYNLDDLSTVGSVNTSNGTPTRLTLEVQGSLAAAVKIYELRVSVTGSTTADFVTVGSVALRFFHIPPVGP